jgi:hypothetical protein
MKIFFTLSLFFILHFASAQVFETIITAKVNPTECEIMQMDSGYLIVVREPDYGFGHSQIFKMNSIGNVVWSKYSLRELQTVSPMTRNRIAAYAYRDSVAWPAPISMLELSVYDSTGILESAMTLPESLVVEKMHPTSDGGTIAVRETANSMILKSDSTGNFEWIKFIDTLYSNKNIDIADIVEAESGGYLAIGTYTYPDTLFSPSYSILIRLSVTGDTIWTKSFENSFADKIYNAPRNEFLLLSHGGQGIVNLDSSGVIKWAIRFPNISLPYYYITDCTLSNDSNYILSGYESGNYTMPFLLKADTSGSLVWMHKYPGSGNYYGNCHVMNAADSGYVISIPDNNQRLLIIKTDSTGSSTCDSTGILPVTFPEQIQSTPNYYSIIPFAYTYAPFSSYVLRIFPDSGFSDLNNCLFLYDHNFISQKNSILIFPNPATNQFTVSSSQSAESQLEIYNSLGEKIYSTVYSEPTTVNCEYFPRGIYFVRLSNSENQFTKKLVIN